MGTRGELSEERAGKDPQSGGVLLFAWSKRSRVLTHFGFFLVGSFVLHALGFYLFQVVYPSTGMLEPIPSKVTLLDGTRPAVSGLLREIEDRLVYLHPASREAGSRTDLTDYSVRFAPSFAGWELEFRPLPEEGVLDELSGKKGNPASRIMLPPLEAEPEKTKAKSETAADPAVGRWILGGRLAERPVLNPQEFDGALPKLESAPAIRLSLGVGPAGSVRFALPRSGETRPDYPKVTAVVKRSLKFEARPGSGVVWGTLEIQR